MIQVAIIGLGMFGVRMMEELLQADADLIIVDKDPEMIDKFKDTVQDAYITDAINEAALSKIIPADIDAVIVDMGGNVEASVMTTNYLKKLGVKKIIVKAETNAHGEILTLVGATQVVYPDLDAAQRLTPQLLSNRLFNFVQVSDNFSLAEVAVTESIVGHSIFDINFRQKFGLTLVAFRHKEMEDYSFISGSSFIFEEDQILLVAGTDEAIENFTEKEKPAAKTPKRERLFKRFFSSLPNSDIKQETRLKKAEKTSDESST